MRLISCYIENFGNLSRYAKEFSPGLTVVQEPNGFGKTTLAEFIRAMFYGFPRAAKDLGKNSRRRSAPWQGGSYGGHLIFEHEGTRYRMERTFGSVPKEDTFVLYDLDKNCQSRRFSRNIGEEIFELDADSFERSTYLPQTHDISSLTTTSIQAKLGELVQDTGDINQFDRAMAALRARRGAYLSYRGEGGSAAQAQRQASELQRELEELEAQLPRLDALQEEIAGLEEEQASRRRLLDETRSEMTRSARAQARESLGAQYASLFSREKQLEAQQNELKEKYPRGLPQEQEMNEVLTLYEQMARIGGEQSAVLADFDEEAFLRRHEDRFAGGVPGEADFRLMQEKSEKLSALREELAGSEMPRSEQEQLAELTRYFAGEAPSPEEIRGWEKKEEELTLRESELEQTRLPEDEQTLLKNLEIFFCGGVPGEEEMRLRQTQLEQAERLREENARIAASGEAAAKEIPRTPYLLILLVFLGLAAPGGGVYLLTRRLFAWGGALLALGIVLLSGAVYLGLRQLLRRDLSARASLSPEEKDILRRNEREACALEETLRSFLSPFICDARPLSVRLGEMQFRRSQYLSLKANADKAQRLRAQTQERAQVLRQELEKDLAPFLSGSADYRSAITELHTRRAAFLALRRKAGESCAASEAIRGEMREIESELETFFKRYAAGEEGEDIPRRIAQLRRDADTYVRAAKSLAQREARQKTQREALKACADSLKAFSGKYALQLGEEDRMDALRILGDVRRGETLEDDRKRASSERSAFFEQHREILESEPVTDVRSLDELRQTEEFFASALSDLSESLARRRQELRSVQSRTDQIPAKRDELSLRLERWKSDRQKAERLDRAMDFLTKAREALSLRYLDRIHRSFTRYMLRLLGEEEESILVSGDLSVRMERLGAARELGYFSAGQSDIVMLCMRLALIEALFKDKKPPIILDDPFVNLDDENTGKALKLLQELSRDHQILYLVCNSSRSFA